jgi:heme-degrading monooxygenase HmoA
MYAVIRTYAGNPALADQLAARSDEVKAIVSGVSGFRDYYLVRTEGGCTSISVYDDQAGAEESSRQAAAWFQDQASEITSSAPQITSGEVLIQAG